jgi:hypothetical protein
MGHDGKIYVEEAKGLTVKVTITPNLKLFKDNIKIENNISFIARKRVLVT